MLGLFSDWKDDFSDHLRVIEKLLKVLQGQVAINSKRIEAMRVLLDQQIKTQSRAADRMADRMIEMALVNSGRAVEAVSHRRALKEEDESGRDPWQDSPDTQWPPPNCDAVNLP